jgi:hypothetical protein
MQRVAWRIFLVGLLLSAAATGQSQSADSLGDIARANHAKLQAEQATGVPPKVITNQDLPSAPPGVPESLDPMTTVSGVKKSIDRNSEQRLVAEQRVGAQWRARIQDQEARVADLQWRIDHLNESMHAVIGTAQYDTPVNRYQSIQLERMAYLQQTLDQQKRKLALMQDTARHAGMGQ